MVAILHPTGPGTQIAFDRAVVLIGRSPECDVVLDMSSKISRMHCALVQVDTAYYIRDLGSLNGVTVAGQRIEKDAKLTDAPTARYMAMSSARGITVGNDVNTRAAQRLL
jgi:pSer/pThr/pTyr-binding forkhead associated (FHA) protein